jgi:hypothetical protein
VDLVNSTKFKSKYPDKWAAVFMKFYDTVFKHVDKATGAKVWKYIGDEVLFYLEISKMEQILRAPDKLLSAMLSAQEEFYGADIEDIVKNFLYFKGALWIAAVQRYKATQSALFPSNIYFDLSDGSLDFLGVEIDEGFRMAGNVSPGKIVVDPKVAYLLCTNQDPRHKEICEYAIDRLRLISYKKLNGIWEERRFPIIWYSNSWADPDKAFLYDEKYANSLVDTYLSAGEKDYSVKKIEKIFKDLGFPMKSINVIKEILA